MKFIDKFVKSRKRYYHMHYCHINNINIDENEENENLNSEVTLQNDEDITFDDTLINIVKGYPHLYDSSCKDYRDVIKKENSWIEISKIMGTSPDTCCNRWTRLRESFAKEKKKRKHETISASGASKRRGFVYFESMKFIDKFVKSRNSMTNIKSKKKYISYCSKNLNDEISNWVQHGKQALKEDGTSLQEIDRNTFLQKKKLSTLETSTINNFDDTSCASFSATSENNNDFVHESLSARSSPITVYHHSSLVSPTSVKSTSTFKKPYVNGKFNPNISIKKDDKNKESDNDNFEVFFINLNKAIAEHLNSKQHDAEKQNDSDTLFCNLILAELKQLDDNVKQIKKQEIMQILWRKENL